MVIHVAGARVHKVDGGYVFACSHRSFLHATSLVVGVRRSAQIRRFRCSSPAVGKTTTSLVSPLVTGHGNNHVTPLVTGGKGFGNMRVAPLVTGGGGYSPLVVRYGNNRIILLLTGGEGFGNKRVAPSSPKETIEIYKAN